MRDVFATGKVASLREQYEHLTQRAEVCRISFTQHRSNENEIEMHRADQALADFLAAHPELR